MIVILIIFLNFCLVSGDQSFKYSMKGIINNKELHNKEQNLKINQVEQEQTNIINKHHHYHNHKDHHHEGHHHQQHSHHHEDHNHEQHSSHQQQNQQQKQKILKRKIQYQKRANQIRQQHLKALNQQTDQQKIINFITSCQKQVGEWIFLPTNQTLNKYLQNCHLSQQKSQLLKFYNHLSEIGEDFTKKHVDYIASYFKTNKNIPQFLKCLTAQRQYQNKYLQQKKKLKYLAQFIRVYPNQGKSIFFTHQNYTIRGQKTCYFLKALFQYYYLQVYSPSETLSTQLYRAITVRTDIFKHEDIAFCISLDTVGKLSQLLQQLDINNIYIKMPQILSAFRHTKLKQKCRNQHNLQMIRNLYSRLQGIDMFRVMYSDYQPYVKIASQKFGHTQILMIATKFAQILNNRDIFYEISKDKQSQL